MFKKIATIGEIEEGKVLQKQTKFFSVALVKWKGEIFAFEDVCSHDGEEISSGKLEDGCIVCPRHLAKFDVKSGKALCMPATEPISTFPVRVNGQDIEIDLED